MRIAFLPSLFLLGLLVGCQGSSRAQAPAPRSQAERAAHPSGAAKPASGHAQPGHGEAEHPERWSDPPVGQKLHLSDAQWRKRLTPAEYAVLRKAATEPAFSGRWHANHAHGIYRCAACGAPLFRSEDKFDSGTGWPSFTRAIPGRIEKVTDDSMGMTRTEVRCARCGSHLGHVFDDGPPPTGKRFCINSTALDFQATPKGKGSAAHARK